MSPDFYKPHIFVLPEDDANHDLAIGFHKAVGAIRQMQVLRPVGGWHKVLQRFEADHVVNMRSCPKRFTVLLIDFDGNGDRLERAKAAIPEDLADRVFVLGSWSEPEDLKAALGCSYERIGSLVADDYREETDTTWGHELLRHNAEELKRLRDRVRRILF